MVLIPVLVRKGKHCSVPKRGVTRRARISLQLSSWSDVVCCKRSRWMFRSLFYQLFWQLRCGVVVRLIIGGTRIKAPTFCVGVIHNSIIIVQGWIAMSQSTSVIQRIDAVETVREIIFERKFKMQGQNLNFTIWLGWRGFLLLMNGLVRGLSIS